MDRTNSANTNDCLQVINKLNMQIFGYTPTFILSQDSGDLTEGQSSIDALYRDLIKFFAAKIPVVAVVERIYMSFFDKEIDIWTIIRQDSEEARRQVYEIEKDILSQFQEFAFDFHIYALSDINLDEFERDSHVLRIYPH